jgi:2-amino-4-hydroxy-6-hydroxymethyldihydropteridine diphosphokinase
MDRLTYYFLLGSNVGYRDLNLELGIIKIRQAGFWIEATSSVYETEPWGGKTELPFLNVAVRAKSQVKPETALFLMKKVERELGRNDDLLAKARYSARIVDIDIIFVEGVRLESERLQIPHPMAHRRLFVLVPLSEVVLSDSDASFWLDDALENFEGKEAYPKKLKRNFLVK